MAFTSLIPEESSQSEQISFFDTLIEEKDGEKEVANRKKHLEIENGTLFFDSNFFRDDESCSIFQVLKSTTQWGQDEIVAFGKQIPLPRLTAWYGDKGKNYSYSKIFMEPLPWTPVLQEIKSRLELEVKTSFNSVLLNFYRDGRDHVSWHSDDEAELGVNPIIASISFGGTRRFVMKHKEKKNLPKIELPLNSGSLLVMRGETQHYWLHQVPKTKQNVAPRINLTFRIVQ